MQGHVVLEGLGGARTSLFAYNTMHGTCLKHLPAQASNDGITFHNASHPTHGVSLRSLRPRRQTPAPAPLTVSWRICLDWMPAVVLPGIPLDLHHFRRRRASRRRSKSKVVETSAPNSSASGHHCSRSHLSRLESVPSFFEEFLCTLRISLGIQIQVCNGTNIRKVNKSCSSLQRRHNWRCSIQQHPVPNKVSHFMQSC